MKNVIDGYSLLKFHGIYQGYDRDSATERKQRGDRRDLRRAVLSPASRLGAGEIYDRGARYGPTADRRHKSRRHPLNI